MLRQTKKTSRSSIDWDIDFGSKKLEVLEASLPTIEAKEPDTLTIGKHFKKFCQLGHGPWEREV